ncbi:MAG: hypothetical protein F4Z60_11270 [Chloroflexi bacterium]|nr:hypothetical protein [Chloroflexota bacterium]
MQHRPSPSSWFLTVAFVAGFAVLGVAGNQTVPPDPEDPALREIIDRGLERAAWAEEEGFETRYRRAMTRRVQRFDGDGEVTDDETLRYQVEPYQGALFARLMARDGEPIDARGRREQERRWEEFQVEIDDPEKRAAREREAEENEIRFDEELIGRYTARLDGVQDLRGRPSHVITFEPRPGRLPVRRRIDHALNRSRGEVWIDRETYEIARVSFQLMDRVRLWWGIIGSISDATGRLERRPVAGDVWLDTEFEIYFHVRVLFRTTRRNTTTQWSEFERAD